MRNYFKKFSIMFVMALTIIGIGMIYGGNCANAATVGDQLKVPEKGWTRYDDKDYNITYSGTYTNGNPTGKFDCYNDDYKCVLNEGSYACFNFIGSKIRIIGAYVTVRSNNILIEIDGMAYRYDSYSKVVKNQTIVFEKLDLENKEHTVKISIDSKTTLGDSTKKSFDIDAIDVVGKLIPYNESISLDKSTMNLAEGDSDKLTAITTPSAVGVTWTVSDPSIATIEVDPTGKITKINALKEGTCIITATTADGSNLSASCTINVTKVPKPDNPTTDTKTGAILIINLTDGETKVFDVSSSEVDKFKSWYNNKSEFENKLTYVFNKTVNSNISVEEDVVHNQITSFEIRKY